MDQYLLMSFMEKMSRAKKLEKEALMMLVPDKMKGHIEVISNELKSIVMEYVLDQMNDQNQETTKATTDNEVDSNTTQATNPTSETKPSVNQTSVNQSKARTYNPNPAEGNKKTTKKVAIS